VGGLKMILSPVAIGAGIALIVGVVAFGYWFYYVRKPKESCCSSCGGASGKKSENFELYRKVPGGFTEDNLSTKLNR
jgi:hypothetical protein